MASLNAFIKNVLPYFIHETQTASWLDMLSLFVTSIALAVLSVAASNCFYLTMISATNIENEQKS